MTVVSGTDHCVDPVELFGGQVHGHAQLAQIAVGTGDFDGVGVHVRDSGTDRVQCVTQINAVRPRNHSHLTCVNHAARQHGDVGLRLASNCKTARRRTRRTHLDPA